jgi:tRNA pseudouridine32 synthase/23S rRNA pseudouridine746 synthase
VLYKDPMVLVINKPAGLSVHAGPSGGSNLEAGLDVLRFGAKDMPLLAHRLDRDTAGCLALGRGPKGIKRLGRLFREGVVGKVYWAIVQGGPKADVGSIDAPLLKVTDTSGWRVAVDAGGKPARTRWRVLGRSGDAAWMEFRPSTGRTHQIRVHAAHLGCPIFGDPQYGGAEGQLQLLARQLTLPLYQDREPVSVEADLPPHMQDMFRHYGFEALKPLASPMVP